jgi:hypothetical protein
MYLHETQITARTRSRPQSGLAASWGAEYEVDAATVRMGADEYLIGLNPGISRV